MSSTAQDQFLTALLGERHLLDALEDAIVVYAHGWAESNGSKDADEDGYYAVSPRWPGFREFFDDIEEHAIIEKALAKSSPDLKSLYQQVEDDLYDGDAVRKALARVIPESKAKGIFEDAVQERWSEIADSASYARDPYAYYGLSRRDFLASETPLREAMRRLATEQPALRAHLVPLLRKQAAALDLHSLAHAAIRAGLQGVHTKLEALKDKAGKLMVRQKFKLDPQKSWLSYQVYRSGDGLVVEGELFFTDEAETYRDQAEVEKLFEAALDVWPTRVHGTFNEWKVHFGK